MVSCTHQNSVKRLVVNLIGFQITCFNIPASVVFKVSILLDAYHLKFYKYWTESYLKYLDINQAIHDCIAGIAYIVTFPPLKNIYSKNLARLLALRPSSSRLNRKREQTDTWYTHVPTVDVRRRGHTKLFDLKNKKRMRKIPPPRKKKFTSILYERHENPMAMPLYYV